MTPPVQLFNTAADLRIFYETSVIDDTPDPNETYLLFNQVKDLIEDTYTPKFLESVDTSQTANVGDTYLTMKPLPDDYRSTHKIVLTNSGTVEIPISQVSFRDRAKWQKIMRKFYVDIKNKQFALCGSVSSTMTINHYYQPYTGQFGVYNENSANPILWPARFWALIPYGAAAIKQGNFDADAMTFRMSLEQQSTFDTLLTAFLSFDHDLKLQDINNRLGYADGYGDDFDNGIYPTSVGLL